MKRYAIIYKDGHVLGMNAYNVCENVGGWSIYGEFGGFYFLSKTHIKDIREVRNND